MITTKTKITLAAGSMAASALLAWGSFHYRGIKLDGHQILGEKAAELAEIKDSKGDYFFSCEDIAKYLRYGGEVDYAWEVASVLDEEGNNKFYGAQLPQMAALKLSIEELVEFNDTEKPNALFVYPTFDINSSNFIPL